jgi:carbonic anhydrase/acetyltransferase-like protein (isoleucine patch superfamily)
MGIEANVGGDYPEVATTAYVHPTATVIGRVQIGERVFIGPHAVVRADEPGPDGTVGPVVIGEAANIQDCVVIHAIGGTGVTIGARTSIAHGAVVHGPCRIGAGCFVGFNSVVFRATLGDGVVVMHQSLVEGVEVPAGFLAPSMTAVRSASDVLGLERVPTETVAFAENVVDVNVFLAEAGRSFQLSAGRETPGHGPQETPEGLVCQAFHSIRRPCRFAK